MAADEAPWPKPAYSWYVVGVLLLAYTLSFVDRTILSLLIGPLRAALKISDTEVSLLLGLAFALFYTVLGLPLGWIADRWSRRTLIGVGIVLWSVMTAGCGLARSYAGLFAMRLGVGVGEATLSPSAFSLISDLFPRERLGRAVAVYSIGVPLGSGIALALGALVVGAVLKAPPVSLPLVGAIEPWRLTFLAVGAPGLLAALLMASVREPARRGPAPDRARGLWAFVRAHPAAVGCHMSGVSLLVLVIYGFMAWTPTFFARTYGLAAPTAGLWFGLITAVAGAAGLLAGGAMADRGMRRGNRDAHLRVVRLCAVIAGALLIATVAAPSALVAFAFLAPAMFVATWHGGVAGAALQLIVPAGLRAQITALYFFVANLIGLGLGPTAIALITDKVFGHDGDLRWSMAIVAAVAAPLSALLLSLGLAPFRRAVAEAEAG